MGNEKLKNENGKIKNWKLETVNGVGNYPNHLPSLFNSQKYERAELDSWQHINKTSFS